MLSNRALRCRPATPTVRRTVIFESRPRVLLERVLFERVLFERVSNGAHNEVGIAQRDVFSVFYLPNCFLSVCAVLSFANRKLRLISTVQM